MDRQQHDRKEARTGNSGFAKKRVQWLIEHLPAGRQVLPRINFCAVLTVLSFEIRFFAKPENLNGNFKPKKT